jgi:hypothetical protein
MASEPFPSLSELPALAEPVAAAAHELPFVLPAPQVEANAGTTLGLVELLLKDPGRVDALNREAHRQAELLPRFLGIALAGYALFAGAMLVILNAAPAAALPRNLLPVPPARWADGSALGLLLGYTLGLVAANGVCLPSFYFFSLLAGVRLSMAQITAHVLRSQASSALVLIGMLPAYVAVVLGMVVFRAPAEDLEWALYLGLGLPFIAGLEGVRAIHRGVRSLAETMPPELRCRRQCFLRRLTVSWSLVYTAVAPVMIYRLWEFFAGRLA